jgi:hypothetical protein
MVLFERLENVSLLVFDLVPLEKPKVLVTKASPGVVPFLVANVVNYAGKLRMAVGKGSEPFLPAKPAQYPSLSIDEVGRAVLYIANQIGQGILWKMV